MTPTFIQMFLWAACTFTSICIFVFFLNVHRRERRLPEACAYIDLQERLQTLQNQVAEKATHLEEARRIIDEADRSRAEAAGAQDWLTRHRDELLMVEGERKQQEIIRQESAGIQEQITTAKDDLSRIQSERATAAVGIESMAAQRKEHELSIAALKQEEEQAHKRRLEQSTEMVRLQREHEIIKANIVGDREQHQSIKNALEQAQSDFNEVREAFDDAVAKTSAMRAERDGLKAEIETYKSIAQRLRDELNKSSPGQGADRYQDLWQPLQFPLLPTKSGIKEQERLEYTADYLQSHGLHFPKRVLYAFHTALKSADLSPLVVMAGISGTGKSELPRRYAEGMGMHLVTLAVQPRWDSPQDLFGFFNHLEGRYKASDLARAMVQFERHNRKDWGMPKTWKHGREDRMLLVLLDEMNLARVEYYFSEFLSRLETRRGVRVDDPSDRTKAEITLDMGSLREGENSIRLFPDRNILFAGTMNEDESTQSLSDKVLDRACVMRFGRPHDLHHGASGTNPRKPGKPAEHGIGYDQWMEWCQGSNSTEGSRQVQDWIDRLNEGMDKVHRPFGHRVSQAMASYVANYPTFSGADRIKNAMADQIEQRILPRLRGLEMDEHQIPLGSIQKIIEEIDDPLLLTAFKDGMNQGTGTFLWRGLDRGD